MPRPAVRGLAVGVLAAVVLALGAGGATLDRDAIRKASALGVVVSDTLYYVANSQYRHFRANGAPDREHLQEPVVLRLALTWLSGN